MLESGEKLYISEPKSDVENNQDHNPKSPEKSPSTTNLKGQDSKSNSKKVKRRAKALKAKMAKIKSADLTERLNIAGSTMLFSLMLLLNYFLVLNTRKRTSDAKPQRDGTETGECPENLDEDSFPIEKYQNLYLSYLTKAPDEKSEIVDAIKNTVLTSFETYKIDKTETSKCENAPKDWKSHIQELQFKYESYPHFKPLSRKEMEKERSYPNFITTDQEIEYRLDKKLKYLCELLQRILDKYKKYWQIDRELEYEVYMRKGLKLNMFPEFFACFHLYLGYCP